MIKQLILNLQKQTQSKMAGVMMAIIMRMVKWLYLNLRRLMVKRIISKVMVRYVVMEFLI